MGWFAIYQLKAKLAKTALGGVYDIASTAYCLVFYTWLMGSMTSRWRQGVWVSPDRWHSTALQNESVCAALHCHRRAAATLLMGNMWPVLPARQAGVSSRKIVAHRACQIKLAWSLLPLNFMYVHTVLNLFNQNLRIFIDMYIHDPREGLHSAG